MGQTGSEGPNGPPNIKEGLVLSIIRNQRYVGYANIRYGWITQYGLNNQYLLICNYLTPCKITVYVIQNEYNFCYI